ncbi:MAG: hypothetical protein V5B32_08010, partial [Candidatus Accumulibacter sp. UW26]
GGAIPSGKNGACSILVKSGVAKFNTQSTGCIFFMTKAHGLRKVRTRKAQHFFPLGRAGWQIGCHQRLPEGAGETAAEGAEGGSLEWVHQW